MDIKVLILVVVYAKSLENSNTILSLNKQTSSDNFDIVIWNNGPDDLESSTYEVINRVDNPSLSLVYNKIVSERDYDYYMLLDDDSRFDEGFLNELYAELCLFKPILNIPSVNVLDEKLYPVGFDDGRFESIASTSIMSGICINRNALDKVKLKYDNYFDTNYALYGVDKSFFIRLFHLYGCCKVSLVGRLHHSLSSHEKESVEKIKYRDYERGLEVGITIRHYPCFYILKQTLEFTFLALRNGRYARIKGVVVGTLLGKHPRCRGRNA
ncbi:hypothetical protein BS055_RS13000 [Vibrio parahaemolyticus]|uniref:Glycosyl transferase n=1 Tax=Vibrio parahaemolyticus TaxID=670 RepID=A0A7M1WDP2_VIBPH|nr:hypothetical protein [Vibrio parahaemolyticus]EJG0872014.1 hypothetical protein [Vibrio parahaemolyticus O3]EJG0900673.1 hypothetical protein [Vibrio parahaemolyticus O3:K56]EJG1074957.1 hypothetical protein [Vibrio parahaemolyticus O1:K56]EGR1976358.1 hypothetical protein [Vibrio parahaemolyticus]EGR5852640.1 hypothetical protein [Vibrio parahaemolyticus]